MKYETNVIAAFIVEVCSFEKLYDITLIYQKTVCLFTTDMASWFLSKLQRVAVMARSPKYLLVDETDRAC
jgi:hypothetical protein